MATNNGGRRPGAGRKPGIPNRSTIERAAIAERVMNQAAMSGRRLGKEVLEEFMVEFAELARHHKPELNRWFSSPSKAAAYEKWATLAVTAARELSKYQSPTFKAIALAAPKPEAPDERKVTHFKLRIFDSDLREVATDKRRPDS